MDFKEQERLLVVYAAISNVTQINVTQQHWLHVTQLWLNVTQECYSTVQ